MERQTHRFNSLQFNLFGKLLMSLKPYDKCCLLLRCVSQFMQIADAIANAAIASASIALEPKPHLLPVRQQNQLAIKIQGLCGNAMQQKAKQTIIGGLSDKQGESL